MITNKATDWLNANYGEDRDWTVYLQDYDDDQIIQTVKEHRFTNGSKLLGWLYDHTDPADEEKLAHLKGFASAERRRYLIGVISGLQEKCRDPAGGDPKH